MKRLSIIISFLSLLALNLQAQQTQDVVYLKNGSIIRGQIMEFVPDESVKIQTADGSLFVFEMEEVEKFTKEEVANTNAKQKKPFGIKEHGYFNETEFGFLFGNTNGFTGAPTVSTVNGYQINRHLRAGIGISIDHYNKYDHTFSGLFARISGDIIKHHITPVYFADAGYGFLWDANRSDVEVQKDNGGLMIRAGIGAKFYTRSRAAFTLSVGYKIQKTRIEYNYYGNEIMYKEERKYNRISVKAGVAF